jgi:hypothetical protein
MLYIALDQEEEGTDDLKKAVQYDPFDQVVSKPQL